MEIGIGSLLRGAQEAVGTAVVIDVFRAFTTAAVAFARGAREIVLVAEVEEALALRERGVGQLCMGEVAGIKPDAFDYGNSPYELETVDLTGKTIIQSTRAGTVGATAASAADKLYLGSFVTAAATVRAVQQQRPAVVSLVAMGYASRQRADEDEQCALYLRNCLQGRRPDPEAVRKLVLAGHEAQKYDDPAQPQFRPQDKDLALDIDRYAFALPVTREEGLLVARPEPRP